MAAKLLNRKQLSHTGFHFRFYDSREFEHMFTQLWVIWVSRNCPFIPFILAHSSTRFSFLPLFVDFLACLVESRYYSIVGFFFFFFFFLVTKQKEYIKAVYYYPAYLTSMQSTSCEMPGWMNHKLESRSPEEIWTLSDMHMTQSLRQKAKRN